MAKEITIYDINLAAYLEYGGIAVKLEKQTNGRVVFLAPPIAPTYEALAAFQGNPQVKLMDYIGFLRQLRGRMLALRDGGTNNGERRNGNELRRKRPT